jgi:hypothetical protein
MVDELKLLYVKMGGKMADVKDIQTDAEMIDKIEDIAVNGIPKVVVIPMGQSERIEDYSVDIDDMQGADFAVVDRAIIGSVKKLTSGVLPDYWGAGNFMALRFVIIDPDVEPSDVKVGINGLAALDNDLIAAVKIEDKTKPFRVITTIDGYDYEDNYNLNGLTLAE